MTRKLILERLSIIPAPTMPADINDFERKAPTDKGRKKRQRTVKIIDYL